MATNDESSEKPKEIDIFYPKAAHHQTVAADGAWASLTTQLEIQLAFYKEIQPMPRRVRYTLDEQGALAELKEKDVETGIIRETGVTIVMNPAVAAQLIGLLQQILSQAQPQIDARISRMQKAISDAQNEATSTDVVVEG